MFATTMRTERIWDWRRTLRKGVRPRSVLQRETGLSPSRDSAGCTIVTLLRLRFQLRRPGTALIIPSRNSGNVSVVSEPCLEVTSAVATNLESTGTHHAEETSYQFVTY